MMINKQRLIVKLEMNKFLLFSLLALPLL